MNKKMHMKRLVDLGMAVCLLLLMAYELIGKATHERIGTGMIALVIIHIILNLSWYQYLLKGRYSLYRALQLMLNLLLTASILGLLLSGIILSRHVFAFLPIKGHASFARVLHMLSAYWGFALMSIHTGLHANVMMSGLKRIFHVAALSGTRTIVLRVASALICGYGIYAFIHRQVGSYMLLQNQFVFFDFREPRLLFFRDYLAMMGLFGCIGHYVSRFTRFLDKRSMSNHKK